MLRVAVLAASFNRSASTLRCLRALQEASRAACPPVEVRIYLTDDASPDGTREKVRSSFPEVQVIAGPGDLYWARGMRSSREAAGEDHDLYLWLNDDVVLDPSALQALIETYSEVGPDAIVVGAISDPTSGSITYSGVRRPSRTSMRFDLVSPGIQPTRCDTFNANVVLIPRKVDAALGGIDGSFSHAAADFDFGLRATRAGFSCWVAPSVIGTCPRNSIEGTWKDRSLGRRERWSHLMSVKGLPPADWLRFTRRHAGIAWPIRFVSPYLRVLANR